MRPASPEGRYNEVTKVRPHIGAALAAGLADKPQLNIRQPYIMGLLLG
jgi:hypothetical protein